MAADEKYEEYREYNPEAIRAVIQEGGDINALFDYVHLSLAPASYLSISLYNRDLVLADWLMEKGIDRYAGFGATAEASFTDPALIVYLASKGFNFKHRLEDGSTYLHYVAEAGPHLRPWYTPEDHVQAFPRPAYSVAQYEVMLSLAIEAGAEVNARDKLFLYPIDYMDDENRNGGLLEAFLRKGTCPDNLLGYMFREHRLDEANLLLDHGADPNASSGADILHWAVENTRTLDFALRLIEAGADVNARNSANMTPLACALMRWDPNDHAGRSVQNAEDRRMELVIKLLEHGADINAKVWFDQLPIIEQVRKMGPEEISDRLRNLLEEHAGRGK